MNIKIFNLIMEVKKEIINRFGNISYDYEHGKSCLEKWLRDLNDDTYNKIFSCLKAKQDGNLIIVKYQPYFILFATDEEDEVKFSFDEFWDRYDGIYRECRGITIDIVNDEIVTLPYPKFFNIGEMPETNEELIKEKIANAKRVEFGNKMDGSLVIARYYKDRIIVSSSGELYDDNYVVKNARKVISNNDGYKRLLVENPDYTCMFESIAEDDIHIVQYLPEDRGLYLTGMRNVKTGEMLFYNDVRKIADNYGVKSTIVYQDTFEEIMSTREDYSASEREGYVVNIDGMLVKIKCSDYVKMHKAMSANYSVKSIIHAMFDEEIDDIRAYASPMNKERIEEVVKKINNYCYLMELAVSAYYKSAPTDRVQFFDWLKSQPSFLKNYISKKYLGREYSFIGEKKGVGNTKYLKSTELERNLEKLKTLGFE